MSWTLPHNLSVRKAIILDCWPGTTIYAIGDAAHLNEHSDHNADSRNIVHAIDVMTYKDDDKAKKILAWCLHATDLEYVIYDHKIYEASNNWQARTYTGSNPHTDHVHISGKHGSTGENSHTGTGYSVTAEKATPTGKPCGVVHPVGSRDVKQGMKGHDVKWIQEKIGSARMGTADGIAGSKFTAGVKWYQQQHKLSADGIVGVKTYAAMGVKEVVK